MTSQEKKIIFTAIGIMVVILLVVLGVKLFGKPADEGKDALNTPSTQNTPNTQNEENYTTELSDGTKINNSEDLTKTKTYKTITISNIQFTEKDGSGTLLASLTNTGTTDLVEQDVYIVLLDGNNQEIRKVSGVIPAINVGETQQLNTMGITNISAVKDFRIEAK